ncbi:MAG: UvrB/UvrC motif-containing protein, partial [Gammaproteobacteria bacterium]|nr:UvrB/UvrC motif-containing protein [Gammaproteobacteria bacterium]
NTAHGITPKSIQKKVSDIMEGAYPGVPGSVSRFAKVAEEILEYASLSPKQLAKKLDEMEKQMYEHAQNLEFEEAAAMRDQIEHVRESVLQESI